MNILKALLTIVRRRLLVLFIVSILAVGSQIAYAHYVYNDGYTYETTTLPCVWNYSEISHGSGYGYAKSKVSSSKALDLPDPLPDLHCHVAFDRPAHHIRAKVQVVHLPPGQTTWELCYNPAFSYNQSTTFTFTSSKTFSQSNWCGAGTYGTWAFGEVKNNGWYGGELWSGTHTLN